MSALGATWPYAVGGMDTCVLIDLPQDGPGMMARDALRAIQTALVELVDILKFNEQLSQQRENICIIMYGGACTRSDSGMYVSPFTLVPFTCDYARVLAAIDSLGCSPSAESDLKAALSLAHGQLAARVHTACASLPTVTGSAIQVRPRLIVLSNSSPGAERPDIVNEAFKLGAGAAASGLPAPCVCVCACLTTYSDIALCGSLVTSMGGLLTQLGDLYQLRSFLKKQAMVLRLLAELASNPRKLSEPGVAAAFLAARCVPRPLPAVQHHHHVYLLVSCRGEPIDADEAGAWDAFLTQLCAHAHTQSTRGMKAKTAAMLTVMPPSWPSVMQSPALHPSALGYQPPPAPFSQVRRGRSESVDGYEETQAWRCSALGVCTIVALCALLMGITACIAAVGADCLIAPGTSIFGLACVSVSVGASIMAVVAGVLATILGCSVCMVAVCTLPPRKLVRARAADAATVPLLREIALT